MPVSQLTGGPFTSILGTPFSNGKLVLQLSQDCVDAETGEIQICSAKSVSYQLNSQGAVGTSPQQFVWSNAELTPSTTYYSAVIYNAQGVKCWGPNAIVIPASGSLNGLSPSNPA